MKYLYLALACLLAPFCGLAQNSFKKGFIVNTQGDTLRGFINDQALGSKQPGSLAFKTHESDQAIEQFTPATSRYVDITGLVAYQSFQGRISMDATALSWLSHAIDTTKHAATIYLKVIQKGKNVTLFSYTDDIKTRFFLQVRDGQVQELGFKKYYDQSNNVRTFSPYTGQLWLAATELQMSTPALQKKIASAQYQVVDLVAITSLLNQLDPQQQQQQIRRQRNNIRFFAGLSIHRTAFAVHGKHPLASNTDSKSSYLPAVSLGLDVFPNRHLQRLFLRKELMLHLAAADISSQQQKWHFDETYNQSFLQPTISLISQLGYNVYNRENLKLNLGIGAAINYSVYRDNVFLTQMATSSDGKVVSSTRQEDRYQFSSFWLAVPFRAGLILNQKTDISLLYSLPTIITKYLDFSFSRSSLQLGVNYLFNRK